MNWRQHLPSTYRIIFYSESDRHTWTYTRQKTVSTGDTGVHVPYVSLRPWAYFRWRVSPINAVSWRKTSTKSRCMACFESDGHTWTSPHRPQYGEYLQTRGKRKKLLVLSRRFYARYITWYRATGNAAKTFLAPRAPHHVSTQKANSSCRYHRTQTLKKEAQRVHHHVSMSRTRY